MSKSIIEAFVIPASKGSAATTLFGILDAETPFVTRTAKDGSTYEQANGLSFAEKKAALLYYQLHPSRIDTLRSELRAFLNVDSVSPEPMPEPEPAHLAPAPVVETLPVKPAPVVVKPAPAPVVATLPAKQAPLTPFEERYFAREAPAPKAPEPAKAEEPIKEATYNGKRYGQFADGSTRQWMIIPGKRAHWKPVTTRIVFDAPAQPAVKMPERVKPAPAPVAVKPAPVVEDVHGGRTVLRELVDGDTLVVLYTNGTYRLFETANV